MLEEAHVSRAVGAWFLYGVRPADTRTGSEMRALLAPQCHSLICAPGGPSLLQQQTCGSKTNTKATPRWEEEDGL